MAVTLEEVVEVIRLLWEGGAKDHDGRYYMVQNARIYTLPGEPPPILISDFGPKAIELAGRIGDGYVNVAPDREMLDLFRSSGGGDKPAHGAFEFCYGGDAAECVGPPIASSPTRRSQESWPRYCRRPGTSGRPRSSSRKG